jgi:hypothetical protein
MMRKSREVSSPDLHCYNASAGLEHLPAKCTHFADKNMLKHIDPGAHSYRRNDTISTESALGGREKGTEHNRLERVLSFDRMIRTKSCGMSHGWITATVN